MRAPYQRRDPDTIRRMEMQDINFRDFLIYRYARPERLGHRTPGNKLIKAAFLVMRDPAFPSSTDRDVIAHHINTDPFYAEGRAYTLSAISKALGEYNAWLPSLKAHLRG